jgi:hypothetical protein
VGFASLAASYRFGKLPVVANGLPSPDTRKTRLYRIASHGHYHCPPQPRPPVSCLGQLTPSPTAGDVCQVTALVPIDPCPVNGVSAWQA